MSQYQGQEMFPQQSSNNTGGEQQSYLYDQGNKLPPQSELVYQIGLTYKQNLAIARNNEEKQLIIHDADQALDSLQYNLDEDIKLKKGIAVSLLATSIVITAINIHLGIDHMLPEFINYVITFTSVGLFGNGIEYLHTQAPKDKVVKDKIVQRLQQHRTFIANREREPQNQETIRPHKPIFIPDANIEANEIEYAHQQQTHIDLIDKREQLHESLKVRQKTAEDIIAILHEQNQAFLKKGRRSFKELSYSLSIPLIALFTENKEFITFSTGPTIFEIINIMKHVLQVKLSDDQILMVDEIREKVEDARKSLND